MQRRDSCCRHFLKRDGFHGQYRIITNGEIFCRLHKNEVINPLSYEARLLRLVCLVCKQVAATVQAKMAANRSQTFRRHNCPRPMPMEGTIVVTCLHCAQTGCSNRAGGEDAKTARQAKEGRAGRTQRQVRSGTDEMKLVRDPKVLHASTSVVSFCCCSGLLSSCFFMLFSRGQRAVCSILHVHYFQHVLALLLFLKINHSVGSNCCLFHVPCVSVFHELVHSLYIIKFMGCIARCCMSFIISSVFPQCRSAVQHFSGVASGNCILPLCMK